MSYRPTTALAQAVTFDDITMQLGVAALGGAVLHQTVVEFLELVDFGPFQMRGTLCFIRPASSAGRRC